MTMLVSKPTLQIFGCFLLTTNNYFWYIIITHHNCGTGQYILVCEGETIQLLHTE